MASWIHELFGHFQFLISVDNCFQRSTGGMRPRYSLMLPSANRNCERTAQEAKQVVEAPLWQLEVDA